MSANNVDIQQELNHENEIHTEFSKEYRARHIRPWPRYLARYIDFCVAGFIAGIIIAIYPFISPENTIVNAVMIIFLCLLLEPISLCLFGTKPGKFLLNIRLTNAKGKKLKIISLYKRTFGVLVVGYGCCIPLLSLCTLISAYDRLTQTGTTYWDKNNFLVTHSSLSILKKIIVTIISMAVFILVIYAYIKKILLIQGHF